MTPEKLEGLRRLALNNPNEEEARSAALAYLRAEAETRGPAPKAKGVSFSSVQSKGKYQTQEQYDAALKARAQEARRSILNNILGKHTDKEAQLQDLVERMIREHGITQDLVCNLRNQLETQGVELHRLYWAEQSAHEARESFSTYRARMESERAQQPTTWKLLVMITRRILCLSQ